MRNWHFEPFLSVENLNRDDQTSLQIECNKLYSSIKLQYDLMADYAEYIAIAILTSVMSSLRETYEIK